MSEKPRVFRRLASIGLGLGVAASASPARTAETEGPRRIDLGADVRSWIGESTGAVFPIVPFFHYEVIPSLFLDLDLALAPQVGGAVSGVNEARTRIGLGNPTLGVRYETPSAVGRTSWFAGARVGFPLAAFGDLESDWANDLASAAGCHLDFYRWVPELMPLVGTVGFEARPTRGLRLRLPVDAMLLIPTTDRRETKAGVAARFEMDGRSQAGVGGGGALQIVISNGFRTREEDHAQTAMEPYFIFDDDRFFARFGVLIALDRPLGFGIEEGGVIAANLHIGGRIR